MNNKKGLSCQWIFLPILFSSASVLAGGFGGLGQTSDHTASGQASALIDESDGFLDDSEAVSSTRMNYVGGDTRIGIGIDTEFKGRIDGSHIFMQNDDSVTSGQGWLGIDPGADDDDGDEVLTGVGAKLNHHWVTRDAEGNPLHVNKVFGAYDQNEERDKKVSAGYGQEREDFFWSGHVSKGLSGKRDTGASHKDFNNAHIYEKAYDYGVGGRVGTFMGDHLLRVQGGLDYEWGTDYADRYEDMPSQLTVSGGVEKFFPDSPHSIGANIEVSKQSGGYEHSNDDADISGNVSYRYDFGGNGLFASEEQYRRVRVEIPGKTERVQVKKKRPPKVERKLVKHTMELESDTFFERGKHYLTPQAKQRLQTMMARIRETGHHGSIRITGNTCDLGSHAKNQTLSENRAVQVRNFMASSGFNPNELLARGLGETSPKYPNNDATRHRNRRVDIEYVAYQNNYKDEVIEQGYDVEEKVRVISEPRVVWRKELIPSPPTWVAQALRNNIQYKQTIDTYRTLGDGFDAGGDKDDNRAPVAVDDAATTKIDTPLSIYVVSNDTDPDGDTPVVTDFDRSSANGGTITKLDDGTLTYTPAAGFVGTDTFNYVVSDGYGGSDSATVTIVVEDNSTGGNSVPNAVNDSISVEPGKQAQINVLGNDTDPDGDTLTIESVDPNSRAGGALVISGGVILYTPPAGFTGTDSFNYTVSDGKGGTATATVTITVKDNAPVNDLNAVDDKSTTEPSTSVTIDVLANDSDPDGDVVLLSEFDPGSTNGGTITKDANGHLVYTPATGFTGTDTFTYKATDGNGEYDTATVSIVVESKTQPIQKPAPDQFTVSPDDLNSQGEVELNVLANDQTSGSTTIRIITHPTKGSISNANNGEVTSGQVNYAPEEGATGTDTFTYALVDGNGNVSDAVTVTINLSDKNGGGSSDGLDAIDDGTHGEQVGDVYSFYSGDTMTRSLDVLSNDIGSGLTIVEIVTPPRFGTAQISADGQSINYTLRSGYCEDHYFVYRIRDEYGNEDEAKVYINVIDY